MVEIILGVITGVMLYSMTRVIVVLKGVCEDIERIEARVKALEKGLDNLVGIGASIAPIAPYRPL